MDPGQIVVDSFPANPLLKCGGKGEVDLPDFESPHNFTGKTDLHFAFSHMTFLGKRGKFLFARGLNQALQGSQLLKQVFRFIVVGSVHGKAMYNPIHVDSLHEKETFVSWLNRSIQRVFPRIRIANMPYGRRSVESQLKDRKQLCKDNWTGLGRFENVVSLLDLIKDELALPNNHLIPQDSFVLLLESALGVDDILIFRRLEDRGIQFTQDELTTMRRDNWTVGEFVQDVLRRKQAEEGGAKRAAEEKREQGVPG